MFFETMATDSAQHLGRALVREVEESEEESRCDSDGPSEGHRHFSRLGAHNSDEDDASRFQRLGRRDARHLRRNSGEEFAARCHQRMRRSQVADGDDGYPKRRFYKESATQS